MGQKTKSQRHPKVYATRVIWGWATAMLAICIPLVDETDSGLWLPLAVIVAAGGATTAVWMSPHLRQRHAPQHVRSLEQRVEVLEAICSRAELDISQQFEDLQASLSHRQDK